MRRQNRLILFFIAFSFFTLSAKAEPQQHAQLLSGGVLSVPHALSDFNLVDANQKSFTKKNLIGHWTLVYFGFTQCKILCPHAMQTLNDVYAKLQQDKQTLPNVVFISIDPERDDLTRTGKFVASFNANFQGATGSRSEVNKVMREFNALSQKIVSVDSAGKISKDSYEIKHTGTIYLINPTGKLFAIFTAPYVAAVIAPDLERIIKDSMIS